MLCGYSSIALLISNRHFHPTWFFFFLISRAILCFYYTAVTEKPSRLRWSYRFTLQTVFSLWKGETELGLLTAGNEGGSGAGSELVMMATVHVMSIQASKKTKNKKKKARQTWDTWNTTSLIRSCANLDWNSKLICFSSTKWCICSNNSYHQESSQWPLSTNIIMLSRKVAAPCNLRLLPGV